MKKTGRVDRGGEDPKEKLKVLSVHCVKTM